ncbi:MULTISPECIES: hypothetical protein [Sorangium]
MNRHRAWSAAAAPLWFGAVALSGCGGGAAAQAPAPMAPEPAGATFTPPQEEAPPETAEDALAALERAEGELDRVLGARGGEGRAVESAPPAAPPPAPATSPSPAPSPPTASDSAPRATAAGAARPSKKAEPEHVTAAPCETACRALASMDRAAQHLCGLAGDADQRCDAARTRVKSATDRVEARCPRCAER